MLSWLKGIFQAVNAGVRGERLAAEGLRRKRAFVIVASNWRSPRDRRDEIDLVSRDGDALVFVEVKICKLGALVPGFHTVDTRKKRVLLRAAEVYLSGLSAKPQRLRIDVVGVAFSGEKGFSAIPEVLHFENLPLFGKYFQG